MSKTSIVNVALRRIQAPRVSDVDTDTSKEAVAAQDVWDNALEKCLRSHEWKFATKFAALAALSTSPVWGWDYAYGFPSAHLRTVSIHPYDDENSRIPYALGTLDDSGDTRCVFANSTSIYMKYIYKPTDFNLLSSDFEDALSWQLALELELAMRGITAKVEWLETMALRYRAYSKSVDGIEAYPHEREPGSWVTDRMTDRDGWG